ncbi:MAG: deoxyguanosinetriphosphate triphosphohydrolase [Clostridia bacterium]|nr:deoxyguanosinetriphosphate triphosphohydrolase [Clostridia bacterium]
MEQGTVRKMREQWEKEMLSPYATLSVNTRGREVYMEPCPVRTEFVRDRDRILHSKSFRRLKHKTQVFLAPQGDHYRTRLTHTLEVTQIARTIARALRLNEDLAEAIAMGHDLGHTPFGHAGEEVLNDLLPGGFKHNEQSLRVVEKLEYDGKGLNLTWEVRDGIVNHTSSGRPATVEGKAVSLADRIAYINHDIDDAMRAGVLTEDDLPQSCIALFGPTHSKRINSLIINVIENSMDSPEIRFSPDYAEEFKVLRRFMFDRVYLNPVAKGEEGKAKGVVRALYGYYCEHPELLETEYLKTLETEGKERAVADFIAGMSDTYAISTYERLFVPKSWS